MRHTLFKGCKSKDGQVEITDSDSLCYIVRNNEDGKITQRIISKDLLNEYVDYFEKNPNADASEARNKLAGKSYIDVQEYVYSPTLTLMAKMVLGDGIFDENNSRGKVVAENSALNQFAYKCFKHLYEIDSFQSFWPSMIMTTISNGATFRTAKDYEHGIVFTGLFKADNTDEGQYFSEGFEVDNRKWYLPSNWSKTEFAPNSKARNALSIQCLERLVERYYPSLKVEYDQNYYKLMEYSSAAATNDIVELWREAAKIVLSVDNNFSKLPLYYHKGHIRVRSNYGGATNFSVGFYDADSRKVDKNISFEFYSPKGPDENEFYLTTDIKDTKAFDYFIPVFNDAYKGLFEIVHDENGYRFNDKREKIIEPFESALPRQVIYFGAPGTGKSHAVNNIVNKEAPKRNIRTTFHPDTDYSSFVGCYKPTMKDGNIEYSFTPQAFINAYVGAWSDLSKPFYLVIEEINRGNCAQIFGDIFQLLDRNENGESSYGIRPDTDVQKYIAEKLGLFSNIPEEIRYGAEMKLPQNLFILATMNTSDQSLFPIDSAFKRRWDWHYTAIKPNKTMHAIDVDGVRYDWSSFIKKVNAKIYDLTKSEDKQLGYWFIKPDRNGDIDWRLFASKAIFYIWNDVIKDYASMEKADSPFGRDYAFGTFFNEDGEVLKERVIAFLNALEVAPLSTSVNQENSNKFTNGIDSLPEDETTD